MNLLILEIPIHEVNNRMLKNPFTTLNYTIILDNARLSDYNHSIYLPAKTIVLNKATELLKMDWDNPDFNLMFTQKKVMKQYQSLKFKKKIKTGFLEKHEMVEEILDNTPIIIKKDSIKQSLWLIELSKKVEAYESVIPQNMLNNYIKLRKSVEHIKPIEDLNVAKIDKGLTYQGTNTLEVKQGLRIKNYLDKGVYEFKNCFYTLGKLARISLELESIWNR